MDVGTLYPTGYGRNTTPFAHFWMVRVPADFVVEDGIVRVFGFSEMEGNGSVEENSSSDVWFSKRV